MPANGRRDLIRRLKFKVVSLIVDKYNQQEWDNAELQRASLSLVRFLARNSKFSLAIPAFTAVLLTSFIDLLIPREGRPD
jgi:hypothetical protein